MDSPPVIIVGAGPAGLACALQLGRQGVEALVLERGEPGGLIRNARRVENLLGFPEGISGAELATLFVSQARGADVRIEPAEVRGLSYGDGWLLETDGESRRCQALVLATGSRPRLPEELTGEPFTEPVDLPGDLSGRRVTVIGGGDVAFDYALSVAERGARVSLLLRGEPRCVEKLRKEAEAHSRVDFEPAADPDFTLVAIGRDAEDTLHKKALACPGADRVHLIGDAAHMDARHVACALGDGVRLAMQISRERRC